MQPQSVQLEQHEFGLDHNTDIVVTSSELEILRLIACMIKASVSASMFDGVPPAHICIHVIYVARFASLRPICQANKSSVKGAPLNLI